MKDSLLLAVVASFCASVSAAPQELNAISYYCAEQNSSYRHTITVGKTHIVHLHQGPTVQSEEIADIGHRQLLQHQFLRLGLRQASVEFLVNRDNIVDPMDGPIARVFFNVDRSELTKNSRYILDSLTALIDSHPPALLIEGHTDNIGDQDYNLTLGLNRAIAVKEYMQESGLHVSHIATRSRGESDPMDTNESAAGRKNNRRVEIY
ncbi:MAG: OmpA family protein [Pseudomonadales bacterium]|nr:OmpA family protein [Pseudomonadales bacterium]